MPKLPIETFARNAEVLQKPIWKTGTVGPAKKNPSFKNPIFSSNHVRIAGVLIVVAVVLTGIYFVAVNMYPSFFKNIGNQQAAKTTDLTYPINIADISFPSDFQKEQVLTNFKNASLEKDLNKRYKLLEDNFVLIRGFYSSNPDYNLRVTLDKFKEYIKSNYSQKFEANKSLYDYLCVDKQCGEVKDPSAIMGIRSEITKEELINGQIKEAVLRNFDAAGLSNNNQTASFYLSAYSMMVSESMRTKDDRIKTTTLKLYDFIVKSFPEIKIPDNLKL